LAIKFNKYLFDGAEHIPARKEACHRRNIQGG